MPQGHPRRASPADSGGRKLDIAGLVLSTGALFLLVYALNMGCEHGWLSPAILSCEVFSIILLVGFVAVERRAKDPLLDVSLLRHSFVVVLVATILGLLMFFGGNFLLVFYLTLQGLRPHQIGFLLMAFSIVYIPLSLYAGSLVAKVSARKISGLAMLFACITGFLFALTLGGGVGCAVVYLVMTAVAYGLFFVPINQYIMSFAGERDRGSISAIFNTVMNITMAMGIAALETIYSEFTRPVTGFRTAFFAAGGFCLAAALMLIFFAGERRGSGPPAR